MNFKMTNLLGAPYRGGNLVMHENELLSPVGNRVGQVLPHMNTAGCTSIVDVAHPSHPNPRVSPNGALLLSIDEEGKSLLINKHRKALLHHFSFKGPVSVAKFSPDGAYLAVGMGRLVQVWCTPSMDKQMSPMQLYRTYGQCHADVLDLDWSEDSLFIAVASKDIVARDGGLFSWGLVEKGQGLKTNRPKTRGFLGVCLWQGNFSTAAVPRVTCYDFPTREICDHQAFQSPPVAFHSKSQFVTLAVDTGRESCLPRGTADKDVSDLRVVLKTPADFWTSSAHTVRTWDVFNGKSAIENLSNNSATKWPWPLGFRPDGKQLAASTLDGTITFWNPQEGEMQKNSCVVQLCDRASPKETRGVGTAGVRPRSPKGMLVSTLLRVLTCGRLLICPEVGDNELLRHCQSCPTPLSGAQSPTRGVQSPMWFPRTHLRVPWARFWFGRPRLLSKRGPIMAGAMRSLQKASKAACKEDMANVVWDSNIYTLEFLTQAGKAAAKK
eukprot:gene14242-20214_t